MKINKIYALYFSPTLTTATVVKEIAAQLSKAMSVEFESIEITTPRQRKEDLAFSQGDLVVFGAPVYIGRMPNLISPYFKRIKGNGAIGIPVAVYGNRAFDDGLIELRDIMSEGKFILPAAAAFIGEHSFSRSLGGGRPDAEDLEIARRFALDIVKKMESAEKEGILENLPAVEVPGAPYPYSGFFKAVDRKNKSIDIRKVKPLTDESLCTKCGLCATLCPMEAINPEDVTDVTGICIKCGACIKRCPVGAKYFTDPTYLSHKELLEEKFGPIRREPELFF